MVFVILSLILTSLWLGWTILTDLMLAPLIFRTIPDFFLAGQMALASFRTLNHVEFPIATVLFTFACLQMRAFRPLRLLVPLNFILLALAGLYLFSLTPKMTELTAAWEYADKMGTLGPHGTDLQQLHQTYHRTYVTLDIIKMLLLITQTTVLGVFVFRRVK